jgi:flagellar basal body-associated protein FliL
MPEDDKSEASPEEPKKKKPILLILVVAVFVGGAATAGALLGPKLMGAPPSAEPAAEASVEPTVDTDIVKDTVSFMPFIVDTKDADGATRHVKVVVAIELPDGVQQSDVSPYVPRGREAAIGYLRGQSFGELTDPSKFDAIKAELSKRMIEAVGEARVARLLITDFVAQ